MSRRSGREVKLTSKFEEFTGSRPNIQRISAIHNNNAQETASQNVQATPIKVERAAAAAAAPPPPPPETPVTPAPIRERASHKILRQKAATLTPATPAYEPSTPATPYGHMTPLPKLTANGKIRGRPRKCWQKAETVVKPISSTREELLRLREENASLKVQLEQRTVEFEDLKRQSSYTGQTVPKVDYDDLKEKYQKDIAYAKRHEWCVVCLNPSRYYCCWNTTYCSQKCQVSDWYNRHVKSCERRKALKTVS